MKPFYLNLFVFILTLVLFNVSQAQTIAVKGTVTDQATKAPISGATILVRGSNDATATDASGTFLITAAMDADLLISSVGYETTTRKAGSEFLNISLLNTATQLSDVVVTALGVRKETKKIGYSVQEVKGADLIKAREPNPINGLVGKVAGLTVGASSEMMQGPQLLLRGKGINLFVVDGVPINSDTWNINPDDVESYTVLKGATASALYGSRGINGAIMVTTKRGSRDKRGFSIEFNSSTMIEKGFNAIPKVQDEYGPGDHGKYAFVDGKGGGTNDGDYDVWGPKFEGQLIPQYDSPVDPVTGVREGTPWVARGKNNLKRFLEPGVLSTNNIAVAAKGDNYDLRFSLTNIFQKAIVPNMKMNSNNFNMAGGYSFSDKLRLESYINYNRQNSPNFPDVNYGPNSLIYNIVIWGGADWNIDDMRQYWQPGKEGVQSIYAEYQRYHNPYFVVNEWLRGHQKTDLNGNMKLSYALSKNWDFFIRSQVTTYDLFRSEKMPFSAHPYGREEGRGDYREDKRSLFENNTDVLLTYTNDNFANGFSVKTSAGGNARNFRYSSSFVTTDYLNVPGLYTFANSRNPLRATSFTSNMLVLSAYGYADIGFKKYANLSLTGRVDKLSTLPADSRTFFYPSASFSTVLSDYLKLPAALTFLKLRGSYANVKGGLTSSTIGATPQASYPIGYGFEYYSSYDGPTYENSNSYTTPLVYDKLVGAYYTDVYANPGLKPFSSTVYETGVDMRFLKSRIGIDATYFISNDGPGIFNLQRSSASGYSASTENGITTQKRGWEVSLTGSPVRSKNVSWNTIVNWSTFKEKLTAIYGEITELNAFLKTGARYDQLIGSQFVHTPDGQIINDAGGRPFRNPKAQFLGYTNPDWVWSLINNVRFKNLSLGFQFDGRVGGTMINYIQQQTYRGGRHINTVEGAMGAARNQDYKGVKSWVGEGVVISNNTPIQYDNLGNVTNYKDMAFAPNTTPTFLQDYISFFYNTNEANLISKTFAKLREVTLTYNLSPVFKTRSFIHQASISLVGRNLLYFSKHKDVDIDQYAGSQGSSTLQTPTTKRYGINLNLTF
ncbi:MAG TPA: SusC/RagA family TonB-linked outer membrane protein [Niastella sp.]|nr:SusC/RagA family TonB-linked outer membrane protein [Niastella sp.]